MAKGWQYFLADSKSLEIIGELGEAKGRTLGTDINKSGNASCTYPLEAPYAEFIWPWRTALVVTYDDDWFWSGPVSMRTRQWAAGKVVINAIGWFEKVMRRLVLEFDGLTFTDMDAGAIAFALLQYANDIGDTLVRPGIFEGSQVRTRTYLRDANIGQEIINLAELEAGYDWYVDPVTRKLNIVSRRGTLRDDAVWYAVQDGEVVEYDGHRRASSANNLADVQDIADGTTVVNQIFPRGANGLSGFADDLTSINDLGLMQEAPSLSDVSDQIILDAYANGEMVYRSTPKTTYQLTPKSNADERVPRFKIDFDLGDTMPLVCKRGTMDIAGEHVRAFGVDLDIQDNGVARISRLQTSL